MLVEKSTVLFEEKGNRPSVMTGTERVLPRDEPSIWPVLFVLSYIEDLPRSKDQPRRVHSSDAVPLQCLSGAVLELELSDPSSLGSLWF